MKLNPLSPSGVCLGVVREGMSCAEGWGEHGAGYAALQPCREGHTSAWLRTPNTAEAVRMDVWLSARRARKDLKMVELRSFHPLGISMVTSRSWTFVAG